MGVGARVGTGVDVGVAVIGRGVAVAGRGVLVGAMVAMACRSGSGVGVEGTIGV